jgi:hypothetical protein
MVMVGYQNANNINCGTTGVVEQVAPTAFTANALYCKAGVAAVPADAGQCFLYKNGVPSALTCTLGAGTSCNDTTHTASFVAGDTYSLRVTTSTAGTDLNGQYTHVCPYPIMRSLLAFLILTTLCSAQVVFSGTGTSMGTGGVIFTTQSGGGGGGTGTDCTGLAFCASPTGTGTDCTQANPCSLAQMFTNLQGHPGGIASGVLTCPSGNNLLPVASGNYAYGGRFGLCGPPNSDSALSGLQSCYLRRRESTRNMVN